ncbi:tRNA1(Val) (adenine(37)-N6)-methyltransferase [Persephonella sp.]
MEIYPDETLTPFLRGKINIIQKRDKFKFGLDSVLLASFPKIKKRGKLIELGTGTGIILILLNLKYPQLNYYGIEIQKDFYDLSVRNFKLNNIKVNMINGNIKEIKKFFKPQYFDYVISNPPYFSINETKNSDLKGEVSRYEVSGKLEDFISGSSYLLKDKGRLFMIYPTNKLSHLITLFKKFKIQPKRLRFIHPSISEKSTHFLIEGMKSGKEGGEIVEKPLIIYDDPNKKIYTPEVEYILENFI